MKAAIWTAYGPPEVLQVQEIEKPQEKDNEVLIKVMASNLFPGDCEMRRFDIHPSMWLPARLFLGIFKPRIKILGQELAGVVEAVGENVSRFKVGDRIFGCTGMKLGAHAEFICLPESYVLDTIPENISFEEATTFPVGGLHALHFLKKANVKPGEKVLLFGSGGCIGSNAVQLAKLMGAQVSAIDHTDKLQMLTSIGADTVIDYTKKDFTQEGKYYDVIIDFVGKSPYTRSLNMLNQNGRYVLVNVGLSGMLRGFLTSCFSNKKVLFALADPKIKDLAELKGFIQEEKIKAVIDKIFSLQDIVKAHRYVESGAKKGHVVININ